MLVDERAEHHVPHDGAHAPAGHRHRHRRRTASKQHFLTPIIAILVLLHNTLRLHRRDMAEIHDDPVALCVIHPFFSHISLNRESFE